MTPSIVAQGERAPAFNLHSLGGRTYTERDLIGRPTYMLLLRHLG